MVTPLETLQEGYPLRLARIGALLLGDLYDPDATSSGDVMHPTRVAAEAILNGGAPHVTLVIRVRSGSGLPDADKRERMQQWLKKRAQQGTGIVWLEGDGFWAAAFRGLLSAFLLATGRRSLFTIVASAEALRDVAGLDDAQHRAIEAFFAEAHPVAAE